MLQVECAYSDFLLAVPHGDRLLRGSGLLPGLLVDLHAVLRPPVLLHCHPEHLHRPRRHEPQLRLVVSSTGYMMLLFLEGDMNGDGRPDAD